jgi:catechol 2,3-dioxygenase-like lactoylglutathione lyase family enzyme
MRGRPELSELVRLRRVRDRIDREYAEPLDVEALARGVRMSAGHLSRQFKLAAFARLQKREVEIVEEPALQPYGVRDCAFRDPAGNLIRLQEVKAK